MNIIKIIIVVTVIIGWTGAARRAEAVIKKAGDIEVITDEPLFSDAIIWYPGLRVEKSFQVKNRGGGGKTAQIETENEAESKQLAKILTVQINEGNRGIYGVSEGKTLRNFFDSAAITLGEVFGDDSGKTFSVAVTMPAGAGNEYQAARAEFDLRIGFVGDSSSTVTMSEESSVVLGKSGEEEEKKEGASVFVETAAGEEVLKDGGQNQGEVKGVEDNRVRWDFLVTVATVGGILGIGGLAGRIWWRRSR